MRILVSALLAAAALPTLHWRELPPLPQALGGQFVGTVGGLLVVAGGSYWDHAPWDGGTKHWTDAIQVFDGHAWARRGTLPQPLAYGASVAVQEGMLFIGGQTPVEFSDRILFLARQGAEVSVREVAKLPQPLAMMSAAVLNGTLYIAGGQPTVAPTRALRLFLSAKLDDVLKGQPHWQELPPWDGPPRFFTHMAADRDSIILAGGSDLKSGVREFLKDAHRFTPGKGWQRLPDLPRNAQAGLAAFHDGRFCLFGGSDGTLSEELREKHPGFRREVLCYDSQANRWREAGRMPASLVTTGITRWRGELVIAGGEDRPGHRSATVVAAK